MPRRKPPPPGRTLQATCVAALLLVSLKLLAAPVASHRLPNRAPRLRVVTFNVHLGEAALDDREHGTWRLESTFADQPELSEADVLGVQEICAGEGGWQFDVYERLVRAGGRRAWRAFAPSDPADPKPCRRGEAIFSRVPIVDSGAITLPNVREPRSAVWADLAVPTAGGGSTLVRVYNAHLENRPSGMSWEEGRLSQARTVLAHLDAWRRDHPTAPVLLLGDLNTVGRLFDPWRREAAVVEIQQHLAPVLSSLEQTHVLLPHQLDWIFFHGLELQGASVVRVILSDHYPVVADFDLP